MSQTRAPRAFVLHAEVLREFGEGETEDWAPSEHALYLAPWRDQLIDGTLGPYHGPMTESRYNEQVRRFEDECRGGIGSPSLWDQIEFERLHSHRSATKKATRAALRSDHEALREYVRANGPDLPKRELEVYSAYWVDGLSEQQTATRLGMTVVAVMARLRSLRQRVAVRSELEELVQAQAEDMNGGA